MTVEPHTIKPEMNPCNLLIGKSGMRQGRCYTKQPLCVFILKRRWMKAARRLDWRTFFDLHFSLPHLPAWFCTLFYNVSNWPTQRCGGIKVQEHRNSPTPHEGTSGHITTRCLTPWRSSPPPQPCWTHECNKNAADVSCDLHCCRFTAIKHEQLH